jgi:predicted MFS family arabinose efflux permease
MARYGYALFFGIMAGGVAAGIVGVALGALLGDDSGWAAPVSGLVGLTITALVFGAILRSTDRTRP